MEFQQLQSISIVELDTNSDVLITWAFPAIPEDTGPVLLERCNLSPTTNTTVSEQYRDKDFTLTFAKYKNTWQYICKFVSNLPSDVLPNVECFCLCSTSNVFNPEKHFELLKILSRVYFETGTPTSVLHGFLQSNTTGKFKTWNSLEFEDKRSILLNCSLKEVVEMFGQASLLLWVAMLLKKRIVVYGDRWNQVQRIVRTLPQLVWHRQDLNIMRPFMQQTMKQMEDLNSAGVYIAGFTDDTIKSKQDIFDIFVDIPARAIIVSDAAKNDFVLDSVFRTVANKMMKLASDSKCSDNSMVKLFAVQTNEYLSGLKKISKGGKLTQEILETKFKGKPKLQRFFYSLGFAESLL